MTKITPHEILNNYLSNKGLKQTHQRKIIFNTFLESKGHVTIEALLDKARKMDINIGYATVYRTLMLLQECGLAVQRHFGEGQSLFEPAGKHHDHLICIKCGKIVEFENDPIEKLQDSVAKKHGFHLKSHRHELYGHCSKCHAKSHS